MKVKYTVKLDRTERQSLGLNKWKKNNFIGIAEYPTGFGKTYTAIRAIKGMIKKDLVKKVLVIVPTLALKDQWEEELKSNKIKIVTVQVVNTAVKINQAYDLLILDEIHRYAAPTFKLVFEQITYKYILGLTATLERADDLHEIILKHLKVIDKITVEEALTNNWVSNFKIYNIAIPFNEEEEMAYSKADKGFRYFAMQLGRGAEAFAVAQQWINSEDSKEKGIAAAYYNSMRKRKNICIHNTNKISAVEKIIDKFPESKGLLFSATTDFASELQKILGSKSMTFHSKMTKAQQKEVIKKFKDNRTKVRLLSTVKALNEGFNVPDCSLGIIAGSNSSKITFIQQLGRIIRYVEDKEAIIINLYTPDTQEEVWLNKKISSFSEDNIIYCSLDQFLKIKFNETNIRRKKKENIKAL